MSDRFRGHAELVLGVVFTAWMVWAVARVPFLPSNDGPQHAFVAYVRNHLDDPGSGWADLYAPNDPPSSNGYVQVVRLLEQHVGLDAAHQAFICGMLMAWSWVWFAFLRRMVGAGSFIPLVAFGAAFQWTLWIGLYPFFLASALTPAVLGLVVPRQGERAGVRLAVHVGVAALLLLQAWLHSFAAILSGGLWVALRLAQGTTLRELLRIAATGLPSALYVLDFSRQSPMLAVAGQTYWDFAYHPLQILLEFFLPGPVLHGVLLLGLVVAAAVGRPNRAVFAVGVLLVAVGTLIPSAWSGWELVRPRLAAPGYLLVFAGFAGAPWVLRQLAAVVVVVFVVMRISWAATFNLALSEELQPLVTAVEGLRLDGKSWVYIQAQGPTYSPIFSVEAGSTAFHLGQQLAPEVHGAPYYSHTSDRAVHHILRRAPEEAHWLGPIPHLPNFHAAWFDGAPRQRELLLATNLPVLSFIDDIVLYGLPADRETLEELGFTVRTHRLDEVAGTATFVASFDRACSWVVHVDGPPRDAVLSLGFGTSMTAREMLIVRGGETLVLDGLPCGPSWFTTDVGCLEDRAPHGIIPVRPVDGAAELTCTLSAE